jgi:hypothetical protein
LVVPDERLPRPPPRAATRFATVSPDRARPAGSVPARPAEERTLGAGRTPSVRTTRHQRARAVAWAATAACAAGIAGALGYAALTMEPAPAPYDVDPSAASDAAAGVASMGERSDTAAEISSTTVPAGEDGPRGTETGVEVEGEESADDSARARDDRREDAHDGLVRPHEGDARRRTQERRSRVVRRRGPASPSSEAEGPTEGPEAREPEPEAREPEPEAREPEPVAPDTTGTEPTPASDDGQPPKSPTRDPPKPPDPDLVNPFRRGG